MNCKDIQTQAVCLRSADGSKVSAVAHYEYGQDINSAVLKSSTRYTDASGDLVYDPADFEEITAGLCPSDTECVESQEWTYGIDNTGTNFRWPSATYEMELSDGSTFQWQQTTAANGGWTPQMEEWGQEIQAAADAAGIKWFVETRFRQPSDPANLAGGGGFAGPPSLAVSNALTSMLWRYVNIQICPGQPVPVAARLISVQDAGGAAVPAMPYNLTTDGAVLGPVSKFWICKECGDGPVWYLEDGVTLAEAGQIPNCWEPCGTLALTDAPPDRECEFFFTEACDNVGEPDDDTNWTNLVTRRATVCSGVQIGVEYFVPDPADASALVDYTLIGDFVDCNTGDVIELPPIQCDNPQIKKIWRITSEGVNGINAERWLANAAPHNTTGNIFTDCKTHVNGVADESLTVTSDWAVLDRDFPATTSNETSQELYYAWIYLPKPAVLQDVNGSTGEWLSAYLGGCGQKPKKVAEAGPTATDNRALGEFVETPAGVYQIVFQVSDLSVFGGITLQESQDGGATFSTFPMSRTYAQQPEINCDCISVCDSVLTELDGTPFEFDADTMSWCEIKCPEVTVPSDSIPDYEFDIVDGCDSVDGVIANFVNVSRETVFINGTPKTTFYTSYGDEDNQAEYTLIGEFVDCTTGEPIDEPEPPPCDSVSYAGELWRVKDTAQLLTTVDYWGGPNFPTGQASAPHDNVSNIFTVSADGRTLEHSVGPPSATFAATFTDIRTSNANFISAVGATDRAETSGNDQIRVRGYVILNAPALLRDVNPNTGERGGLWINRCCAGSLELAYEDTTDSAAGDTGIFNGVLVPAGRHYIEAVTSDLSAWQGFQLDASFDDGASYAPLPIYDLKPEYECISLVRCDDTGQLLNADTQEVVTIGPDDLRCEPPACIADNSAESTAGPTAQEIAAAMVDEERSRVSGRRESWQNQGTPVSLDVPPGTMGCLRTITDYGTGSVLWNIEGLVPTAGNSHIMSVQYGPNIDLCGIDLSLVRIDGSSAASDFGVTYEVWS